MFSRSCLALLPPLCLPLFGLSPGGGSPFPSHGRAEQSHTYRGGSGRYECPGVHRCRRLRRRLGSIDLRFAATAARCLRSSSTRWRSCSSVSSTSSNLHCPFCTLHPSGSYWHHHVARP